MKAPNCKRWVVAGSLAVLAGCAAQPSSLPEIDAAMRERLALGLEAAEATHKAGTPLVLLDKRFGPSLRNAVLAHEGYIAALAYEAEAMAGIGVATSARRPQLSANATVGSLREGRPVSETTTGAAGDLTLSQLLYDGGASGGAIGRAQASALAAQADRMDRANMIALEAARAWLDLWLANERLALLERKIADLADLMVQMERMAANGLLDRAAIEGARRQQLDIQLERTSLNASRSEAALRFEQYFRQKPVTLARPDALVSVEMARARAPEWRNAPALKRTIAELFAAQEAAQEARSAFRPAVSLQAGIVSPMDQDDTTDVRAGLRLQYVFNDGGRRKTRFEAAQKRVAALEAQLAEAQRTARSESEAALVRLAALDRSMGIVAQQIELSASEAQIARSQIATGQANLQQLVAAEVQHYRAVDQQIQMQAERQVLLLSLAAGTGYLTELIELTP
jgi:outer membrane protein, adhesin transport system